MNRYRTLFLPPVPRDFRGKRWLKIVLRTLHLIGIAGVSGGILFSVSADSWYPYLSLTFFSGVSFLLLEIWSSAIFCIQLRGLIIFLKLALLPLLFGCPQHSELLWVVIILSSVVSHAPGNFRYYSLFHRRRLDHF